MNDAVPTLAPTSRADNATNGRIAPWPIATRMVGPYAVIAMSRQRVGSALIPPSWHNTLALPRPPSLERTYRGLHGAVHRLSSGTGSRVVGKIRRYSDSRADRMAHERRAPRPP